MERRARKPSHALVFLKSQMAALVATAVDFTMYIVLVEIFGIWYVTASAVGAASGAICNFLLGRHWCFEASEGGVLGQGLRYLLVSSTSLLLNTSGVWLLTDVFSIHYVVSKIIVSLCVAMFFNFPLQRHFVFKKA